jgi:hypothetical protein
MSVEMCRELIREDCMLFSTLLDNERLKRPPKELLVSFSAAAHYVEQ